MQINAYILALVTLLAMVALWWVFARMAERKLNKEIDRVSDKSLYLSQFRCVKVNPCAHACRSAVEQKKAILVIGSPKLPLAGCTERKCTCSFTYFDDRRCGLDRRSSQNPDLARRYADKRWLKDRRRDSIREFMLPQYRDIKLG